MLIVEGREGWGGEGPNKTYERERREEGAFKNQIHRHSVRENQFINTVLMDQKWSISWIYFFNFFVNVWVSGHKKVCGQVTPY